MALDPRSREGLLAGRLRQHRLRRLARADQVVQQLIQQVIQKKTRELRRHLGPTIVSGRPAWNTPAATPVGGEARTEEKTAAREKAAAQSTFARVPDVVQVITAYRAWRAGSVMGQARLVALGLDVVWEPRQKAEAECKLWSPIKLGLRGLSSDQAAHCEHEAPDFYCHCGIWGFKSVENLLSALGQRYKPSVIGKVSLWGRVIETENGFRAQYAYPEELWACSTGASAEELGLVYGIPVKTG